MDLGALRQGRRLDRGDLAAGIPATHGDQHQHDGHDGSVDGIDLALLDIHTERLREVGDGDHEACDERGA